MTSLAAAEVIAFAPSTDLARSRRFFGEVLGLEIVEVTPFACVVRNGGAMIRVTAVDTLVPQPFTVLGWAVADIAASVVELVSRGVEFLRYAGMEQDDNGVWTTPGGDKVAWFSDPDGNVLSLTEFVG
ncbi:extradiol dioxygenase family protein [Nocardia tenerifensis]|uniref:Extradiol dioxygenase family protein n=1 Tax=Nocardia tenerifensis TaxID=228006 RepID=A0A318K6A4_9NOCA|nr:VOC family protein [Nocardia tenerifensis]PXX64183.1 extradiol dioxygenase family protein [Nocardia tenerifensis]